MEGKVNPMKKLSVKQLKLIRNLICLAGIVGGFILWIFLPDTFRNTSLFHVGDGTYGFKAGALILLPIQFFAFIPDTHSSEIHTEDQEERTKLEEERARNEAMRQIFTAIFLALAIWAVMGAAVFLCP